MKRLWLGIVLLVLLSAAGAVLSAGISSLSEKLSTQLDQAGIAVQAGNWSEAVSLADSAQKLWKQYRHFTAAAVDHEPLEQMERLFAQLALYCQQGMAVDYGVTCAHLSQLSKAIGESHALKWWSFL